MKKFQNKYHISSARKENWDYATNGAYFVTICCQNHKRYFGIVENKQMQLNEIGRLAMEI